MLLLSLRLTPVKPVPGLAIDRVGVVLAASAVVLISLGFDSLENMGWLLADRAAPFDVFGLSPAPIMIVCGVVGLGQGALATMLFNVLVSASPVEFAGDLGALRGTVTHLAAAVGTAVTGAFVVAVLSANIQRDRLSRTTATPEQVEAAMVINPDARLRALKLTFLLLTGLGLLAFVPAGRLPDRSVPQPGRQR